jgi:hypothetical protein
MRGVAGSGTRHWPRPAAAVTRIGALAVVGVVLAGCELLGPPADGFGEALATYETGYATMTIGDETIQLDQIAPGPHLTAGYGAEVYWYNDEGWGLRISGGEASPGFFDIPAMLSIDRVRTTYWSAMDWESGCDIKLTEIDEHGIRGTATCKGLRWTDMLHGGSSGWPQDRYVEGEPAFDATLEFEALPKPPAT